MSITHILVSFGLLILAMTVHEFSHGWAAYTMGDPTAKFSGRLTLNPLAHIDPVGTVILPLILFIATRGQFVFGAAKPIPINYLALNNPKKNIIWIGAVGPLSNLLFAAAASVCLRFFNVSDITDFVFKNLVYINLVLGIFNLIPVPPLDGSRIVLGLLPDRLAYRYASIEPYGFVIVILLIGLGAFDTLVMPLVTLCLKCMGVPFS